MMIRGEAKLILSPPLWLFCSLPPHPAGRKEVHVFIPSTPIGKMRCEPWALCQGLLNKTEAVLAEVSSSNRTWWERQPVKVGLANTLRGSERVRSEWFGPWTESSPLGVSVNKVLLENSRAHSFRHVCESFQVTTADLTGCIRPSSPQSLKYLLSEPV